MAERLDRLGLWICRAGGFALPLLFAWNVYDGFVLPKLLGARLLVLALAAVWGARLALTGGLRWRRTPVDLPLLAFVATAALATLVAENRNVAVFGTYQRYEGLATILSYAGVFWFAAQFLAGPADARSVVMWMLAGAYLVSVIAILQVVFGSLGGAAGTRETAFTFGGLVRADGTFGNPNELGAFLAMLLPVAVRELVAARSAWDRLVGGNLAVMMVIALLLTFSRSSWVGAAAGIAPLLLAGRLPRPGGRVMTWRHAGVAAAVAVLLAGGVALVGLGGGGLPLQHSIGARAASLQDLEAGSAATRLHIWRDTLRLIASRPITGYGPDNFGLVFPRFQTGDWTPGFLIDRAHAEVLDVAATQGLLGVAAYLWLLAAFVAAWWRGRGLPLATAMFGGWLAFQVSEQVNFSFVPAAVLYWLFAAASVRAWAETAKPWSRALGAVGRAVAGPALAVAIGLAAVSLVARPYLADAAYFEGLGWEVGGDPRQAAILVGTARGLAPEQSAYPVEAGDLALRLDAKGCPGAGADWAAARSAYLDAAQAGTFDPDAYRRLAIADAKLGRLRDATSAAREALALGPFDAANRAAAADPAAASC